MPCRPRELRESPFNYSRPGPGDLVQCWVLDAGQNQPVSGRVRTSLGAIFCFENRFELCRFEPPPAHLDQRPHDPTDHVPQERICRNLESDEWTILPPARPLDRPNRRSAGRLLRSMPQEASKIVRPEQPWEPFQGVNHISNLARSGVVAMSRLSSTGWIEADPPSRPSLPLARGAHAAAPTLLPASDDCEAKAKRPHIIMLLDESSFDVTAAPGIKVPAGYTDYFKSVDGKQRSFVADWSLDDVSDAFELRAMLEGLAARRAAERMTDAALERIRLANRQIAAAIGKASPDVFGFLEGNREFHAVILEVAASRRLAPPDGGPARYPTRRLQRHSRSASTLVPCGRGAASFASPWFGAA